MTNPKDILFSSPQGFNRNLCLVLMPFRDVFDGVFDCISRAVESEEVGMTCVRADEIISTKSVVDDILKLIVKANIIIADVTGLNPNVLYELGVSHAVKDKVILITQDAEALPFDFRHLRVIEYDNSIAGGFGLVQKLKETIKFCKTEPSTPFPTIVYGEANTREDIEVFYGSARCLERLVQEFTTVREKNGDQTAIIRAVPVEFTEAVYGTHVNGQILQLLREYKDFVKHIVVEGAATVDNWDYSIYGRVANSDLNRATARFVEEIYFGGDRIPDTSEVGADASWCHFGFQVLGRTASSITEFEPDCTVLIYGDPVTLRPESGCIIRDPQFSALVIKRWYESLKRRSLKNGLYWNFMNDVDKSRDADAIKQRLIGEIIGE